MLKKLIVVVAVLAAVSVLSEFANFRLFDGPIRTNMMSLDVPGGSCKVAVTRVLTGATDYNSIEISRECEGVTEIIGNIKGYDSLSAARVLGDSIEVDVCYRWPSTDPPSIYRYKVK